MLNSTTIAKELSSKELKTESLTGPRSLAISEHSLVKGTPKAIREWLMSLQPDSRVNPSQLPERGKAKTTTETCGLRRSQPFALYDPSLPYLKTCQACLLTNTEEPFSETWPKAGMSVDGAFYPLPKWERRINEIGSGLLPTPTSSEGGRNKSASEGAALRPSLGMMAKHNLWPTPTARDWRSGKGKTQKERGRKTGPSLAESNGGQLNPNWVEWLMGWPINWSSLKPMRIEDYEEWEHRVQGVAKSISGSGGRLLRSLWWDQDPSETPYRPESHEQRAKQYSPTVPGLPQQGASKKENASKAVRDMQDTIPTEKVTAETLRSSGMPERKGEIISRVAVGIENRMDRIKALGNGQVPPVVAAAWRLLTDD